MDNRRSFLAGLLLAAFSHPLSSPAQNPPQPRLPGKDNGEENPPLPDAEKKSLEDNDKDMKKKVDRLYELASELKDEVDKTDSSKVLSLNLMKKAEEIEKLARDIKNRSKG